MHDLQYNLWEYTVPQSHSYKLRHIKSIRNDRYVFHSFVSFIYMFIFCGNKTIADEHTRQKNEKQMS